jgi:hypothetical protein
MNAPIVVSLTVATLACAATSGRSQQPTPPQPPPVRQIATVAAVSRDSLASVTAAVEVAGGRVYVNDITARRVLLYDSTLANAVVIADSDGTTGEAYGARPGTLLPFHGDSALLITPASLSMLVLSPAGTVARVMAMPPGGSGMPALIGSIFGTPGFDARGRLVFFAPVRMVFQGRPGDGPIHLEPPDSALIVRFDFATRTLDTVGAIRIPKSRSTMARDDHGRPRMTMTAFPPTMVDDWAVTADGRIAVVRGRDYHVDWLDSGGAWTATPRMPYAWERLDDDQKTALIDSLAAALQAVMDSLPERMQQAGGAGGAVVATRQSGGSPGPAGGGGGQVTVIIAAPGDGPGGERHVGPGPGGSGGAPATTSVNMMVPTVLKALPADVPDYRPPFRQGAVRADLAGNLWIRTGKMVDGRPVYDVVNGRGEVTDRVQLPPFRTIAGFGRNVLYLGVRDSTGVTHLERARIR